jgi:hypothetical protein
MSDFLPTGSEVGRFHRRPRPSLRTLTYIGTSGETFLPLIFIKLAVLKTSSGRRFITGDRGEASFSILAIYARMSQDKIIALLENKLLSASNIPVGIGPGMNGIISIGPNAYRYVWGGPKSLGAFSTNW